MEGMDYLRFLFALVFVLGLIGIIAAAARRFGWGFPTTAIKPSKKRRLSVVEVTPVDGRRRMVLVRRDNVEHLLIISPTSETLIETKIVTSPRHLDTEPKIEKHQGPEP